MAVIQKYIEFLREYNKLLERGSKNVYHQRDTLWLNDIENISIVKDNNLKALFTNSNEDITSGSLLQITRPQRQINEEPKLILIEEEIQEIKLDNQIYSYFSTVQKDIKSNTNLEFVCGFGLFNIRLGDNKVKVHLFNIPLKASLVHSTIYIGLSDDIDPYIDPYFLNHAEIDRYILESIIKEFDEGISNNGIAYLQSESFKTLISKRTLELHSELEFNPSLQKLSESVNGSFISYSPCFILRKKRPRYFQKLMNKIIRYTNDNDPELNIFDILLGQKDNGYIETTPYFTQLYNDNKERIKYLNSNDFETFFPLPYNNEQLAIYQNYKTHDLSVVTGPPGTGKSHSIVNLLCAILAEGKRVLITAKTDKALESLLNKIPSQFNGLLMANVEQEHSSDYTLSNSIESIRDLLLEDRNYTIDDDLKTLDHQKKLYIEQRTLLASVLNKEYERIKVEYLNKDFSLYGLYLLLKERSSEWEWIQDSIKQNHIEKNEEIIRSINYLVSLKDEEKETYSIDLDSLANQLKQIDFDKLDQLNSDESNLLQQLEISSVNDYLGDSVAFILANLKLFKNSEIKITDELKLQQVLNKCSQIPQVQEHIYTNLSTKDLIENRNKYLRDTTTYLSLIPKDSKKVSFSNRFLNSKYKEVKYLDKISLSDSFCDNRRSLLSFRRYLGNFSDLYRQIEVLNKSNLIQYTYSEECNLVTMRQKVKEGLDKGMTNLEVLRILNNKLVKAFSTKYNISYYKTEELVDKASNLDKIWMKVKVIRNSIDQINNSVEDVREKLNNLQVFSFSNNSDVMKAIRLTEIAIKKSTAYRLFQESKSFLSKELPKTTKYLLETDTNVFQFNKDSIHLKEASKQIQDISQIDIQRTIIKLNHYHKKIEELKGNILSGLAKENFKNRFSPQEKNSFVNSLNNYENAFKQSKRGIRDKDKFRRRAQNISHEIAPSISCWVMKIDDVFQTLDENPYVFDCVIVDEASQLDFNSLLLGYYTKRMIVVGDEKQTSPEGISISSEALNYLRETKLGFMEDDAINIRADSSLFSLSKMVAGTTHQTLREHFRCVPELIEFSRVNYYDRKIIPLKLISSDRLTPKLTVSVKDSYVINKELPKEIKAIELKLNEMLINPLYENKSIGIVSLGSANHTRGLKNILVNIDQDKSEKHNIVIDNPSEFQGDERDVIIVSLGVGLEIDKNGRFKQPTSIVDNIENNLTPKLRGINVGLSRAKEQMILFHSVSSDDLKANDFRRKIISFFYEEYTPIEALVLPPDVSKPDRMVENRPKPFDSWFEYDVAKDLIENGFTHIVPQYEVKKEELFTNPRTGKEQYVHFKIDLVVYHNGMPVAIECDGDWFHSEVEDVAYDIERQEFLQRIGWNVHRITYSSYKINPKEEIDKLVAFILKNTPQKATPKIEKPFSENETKRIGSSKKDKQNKTSNEKKDEIKPNEETIEKTTSTKSKGNNIISSMGHKVDTTENQRNKNKHAKQQTFFNKKNSESNEDLYKIGLFSFQETDDKKIKQSLNQPKKLYTKEIVINSICDIKMLDMNDKKLKVQIKDISSKKQSITDDGIQIVSIYSDLGKILLGSKEGGIISLPQRKQRIKIVKIYNSNVNLE